MTAPPRSGEPPRRDPALDDAWRAHSTELPPAHVDAALLAAAHREVKSRPHGADDDALAEAREPSRWWWGLAAAATIGAVAFGLVQLAPPVLTTPETTVASDVPPQAPASREQASTRVEEGAAGPATQAPSESEAARPAARDTVEALRPPGPEAKRAETKRGDSPANAGQERERASAPQAPAEVAAPPAPATPPAPIPLPETSRAASAVTEPRAFPGAASKALSKTERDETSLERNDARQRSAGDTASSLSAPERRSGASRPAPDAAPPAASPAAPSAGAAPRMQADRALGASASRESAVRSPQAFIDRIRRLHDATRLDEAAAELRAFRAAYADADERLPPELRRWAGGIAP